MRDMKPIENRKTVQKSEVKLFPASDPLQSPARRHRIFTRLIDDPKEWPAGPHSHRMTWAQILSACRCRTYEQYLESSLWKSIKQRVYQRFGHQCSICEKTATEIHHASYCLETMLGKRIRNLFPLCEGCHQAVTFDENGQKRPIDVQNAVFEQLVLKAF